MYESKEARTQTEAYLDTYFMSEKQERIPTENVRSIKNPPDIWRYFLVPHPVRLNMSELDEAEYTMQHVFHINGHIPGPSWRRRARTWGRSRAWAIPRT